MVLSDYSKQWILCLHWKGYKVSPIVEYLVLGLHKIMTYIFLDMSLFFYCFIERLSGTFGSAAKGGSHVKASKSAR